MSNLPHCKRTCAECPWRRDVKPGRFPPERFRQLAGTAYDMAVRVFACHKSPEGKEFACAGAIKRTGHSLTLRMAKIDPDEIRADGPLFEDFREMAVANGVDPGDPALAHCR